MNYVTSQPLQYRTQLLRLFAPQPGCKGEGEVEESFIPDVMRAALEKCRMGITEEDGVAIIDMAQNLCDFEFFQQRYLTFYPLSLLPLPNKLILGTSNTHD